GGFSGARLWRVQSPGGDLCLRAWPAGEPAPRVLARHHLVAVARAAGLTFVPAVFSATDGTTAVEQEGRVWELQGWLPGKADFPPPPPPARLASAARALARLHDAWRTRPPSAVCPAVERRLDATRAWDGLRPPLVQADPLHPLVGRAHALALALVRQVNAALAPWRFREVQIQPCLCDVWHDHLLFSGDELTGLVDYGSIKTDHVAADLARMLGSL